MHGISSRASGPALESLAECGVPIEELVRGTGVSIETLRRPGRHISWEQWTALLARAEELGGPDVLERAGERIHEVSWNRILAAVGRVGWTEAQFWRLVTQRIAPAIYPQMSFSFEVLDGGRFRVEGRIRPEYGESLPLPMHKR